MPETAALVSVEEYLAMDRKPNCDYIDGVLLEKSMPTWKHSRIQFRIIQLIEALFPDFVGGPELTIRINEAKYLVPDIGIQLRSAIQDTYPIDAIHLCVEVMSPDDKLSAVLRKCEEYHAWGVKTVWVVDPEPRFAWIYSADQGLHDVAIGANLTAGPISIPLADVFAAL